MRWRLIPLASPLLLIAAPSPAQTRLGGFVEYDNLTYFTTAEKEKVNARNASTLQLEVRHVASPNAEVFAAVELRVDQADRARDRTFLDEAYVDLFFGDFDIRVGKQIYAWGRADGINPTDNLTVWDYSDVLDTDDEQIGQVSIRTDYYFGPWTLEGVLVPSFTPSVLPRGDSRWFPPLPGGAPDPALPGGARTITFADPLLPDEGLESFQYALKLTGSGGGWDYSVSWFDGFNDLPALRVIGPVSSPSAAAGMIVEQSYHRRRTIGADFATAIGKLGAHGEAAYYITEDWRGLDPAIDDPYLQFVLGGDYTIRDLLPDKDLFLLLEWVQEVQVPDRNGTYRLTDLNHLFRKSLFARADLGLGEFAKLTLEGVANFATDDWWLRPGFWWSAADALEIVGRVDLLYGPDDSFFGLFRDNRRAQVRVKYSF